MSDLIPEPDKRFYATGENATCVAAFPAQDYYRTMRHRELTAYRTVLQCIAMHHHHQNEDDKNTKPSDSLPPIQLTRAQQRLLEDLEDELVIPASRREAELVSAQNDVAVAAVRASGVATRRPLHFDGVTDVRMDADDDFADDTDDDGAVIGKGQKQRRPRGGDGDHHSKAPPNSAAAAAAAKKQQQEQHKPSKPLDAAMSNRLEKLKELVPKLAGELVLCAEAGERAQKLVQLTKLRSEVEHIRSKALELCTAARG